MRRRILPWVVCLLSVLATACVEDAKPSDEDAAPTADGAVADVGPDTGRVMEDAAPTPDGPRPCAEEDDLAPNHAPASATAIEAGFNRSDLFVCPGRDDHYRVTLGAGDGLTVRLSAEPARLDLDLVVLNAAGETVVESVADGGTEQVQFVADAAGDFTIVVQGFRNDAAAYSLVVSSACRSDAQCPGTDVCDRVELSCRPQVAPNCGQDAHEPNDRDNAPAILPGTEVNGSLCRNDRDWFSFTAEAGDSYEVLVSFPSGDNLDLFVLDDAGRLVSQMANASDVNPERFTVAHLPAGTYKVGITADVAQSAMDRDIPYLLEVIGRGGRCDIDRDCDNFRAPVCDEGVCRAVSGPSGPGGRCSSDTDCGPTAPTCYTGRNGGHDNVCTRVCSASGQCSDMGLGAQCQQLTQTDSLCVPACQSDDDCSIYSRCARGSCQFRGQCNDQTNCQDDEECAAEVFGQVCRLIQAPPACGLDPALDPHGTADEATPVQPGTHLEDLSICTGSSDWYRIDVPPQSAGWQLEAAVSFRSGVDIDIYVTDAIGRGIAESTTPENTVETATAQFVAAGVYYIRVEQFSSDRLADTAYSLDVTLIDTEARCTEAGEECARIEGRTECEPESGACVSPERDED